MEAELKKIRVVTPYLVHPETKQIYGIYRVLASWPDGRKMLFDSEEHASAYIDNREPDSEKLEQEVPQGFREALKLTQGSEPEEQESEVQEQKEFSVFLTSVGERRVPVIKAIKEVTGLGLKESKDKLDSSKEVEIVGGLSKDAAEEIKSKLDASGAITEIR
jgi:ribosomal protein L7/L12